MKPFSQDLELLLSQIGQQERDFPLDDSLGRVLATHNSNSEELSKAELSQVVAAGGQEELAASWRIWQKLVGS